VTLVPENIPLHPKRVTEISDGEVVSKAEIFTEIY